MKPEDALLGRAARRLRARLRAMNTLAALGALLQVAGAWVIAHVVAAALFAGAGAASLGAWFLVLVPIVAGRMAIAWALERCGFALGARVRARARLELLSRLRRRGPVWLEGREAGALVTAVVDAVEALDGYFARYLPQRTASLLVPLVLVAAVAPADWVSGLVLLATAPLIPLFMILVGKGAEALNRRQWHRLSVLGAHFMDVLQGLATLKLFDRARAEAQVVRALSEHYRSATMAVLRVAFLSSLVLEFFSTLGIASVAVLVGFRLLWGDLGFEQGFFVLLLAPEFYQPLRRLGSDYHARMDALGAASLMLELEEGAPAPAPRAAGRRARPARPALRLDAVSVRYPDGRDGLRGLSLEIPPGTRLAVVGRSGAGKSTLLRLLLGFLAPSEGAVYVDGVALSRIDPRAWRAGLAWLPQQPRLMHASVAENIVLGRPGVTRAALEAAARAANAHEFIERLPRGYDTLIGDGGQGLSGGEAQRLSLARAFLRAAPLVLFDEPSAHLDARSEALVNEALERLGRERTFIVVAHRRRTVERMDAVAVLDGGRLAGFGTHAALLAGGGEYARLMGCVGSLS